MLEIMNGQDVRQVGFEGHRVRNRVYHEPNVPRAIPLRDIGSRLNVIGHGLVSGLLPPPLESAPRAAPGFPMRTLPRQVAYRPEGRSQNGARSPMGVMRRGRR